MSQRVSKGGTTIATRASKKRYVVLSSDDFFTPRYIHEKYMNVCVGRDVCTTVEWEEMSRNFLRHACVYIYHAPGYGIIYS